MSSATPIKPPSKVLEWTRLIAITGSAQVAVQAIGFVCGILVIQLLPVDEYALYTLANTMLGTMTLLADGGVASGVMSQGGKVWEDKHKLGAVLSTGFYLRRRFALLSLLLAVPILLYLLQHHGASWATSVMITLSLVPAFLASLHGKLLEIAPKLHQDVTALQNYRVVSNAIRLLLSASLLFLFPFAAIAILSTGIAQSWWNRRLRLATPKYAETGSSRDIGVEQEILRIVKRVLPSAIYFSFSTQLGIWILSFIGSTDSVAQLGALSRITTVASIFTAVFAYLVAPRFARLPDSIPQLKKYFISIQLGLYAFFAIGFLLAYKLATPILSVLPAQYSDLTTPLRLRLATVALTTIVGALVALNTSRGFVLSPFIHIPLNLAIVVITLLIFRPTTLLGVLWLDLTRALIAPLVQNLVFFSQIGRFDRSG